MPPERRCYYYCCYCCYCCRCRLRYHHRKPPRKEGFHPRRYWWWRCCLCCCFAKMKRQYGALKRRKRRKKASNTSFCCCTRSCCRRLDIIRVPGMRCTLVCMVVPPSTEIPLTDTYTSQRYRYFEGGRGVMTGTWQGLPLARFLIDI